MKLKTVPILAGVTLASVLGIGGVQLAAAQDSTTSTTVQDSGSTTTAPDSSTDNSTTTPPDSSTDGSTDGSSGTQSAPSKENCPNMGGSSDSSSSSSGSTSSAYRTGAHNRSV